MSKRPHQHIQAGHSNVLSPGENLAKGASLKKSLAGTGYAGDNGKKQKAGQECQRSILSFFQHEDQGETPALGGRTAQVWPSTAQRKLEKLAMVTPVLDEGPSSLHVDKDVLSGGTQRSSQPTRVPTSLLPEASLSDWGGGDDFPFFSLSQNMNVTVKPSGHQGRGNENLVDAFLQVGQSQQGCNGSSEHMTLFPPDDAYDALEGQGSSQPLADDQHGQGHGQHQRLSLHGKEKTLQFVPQHFDQAPASSCGPAVTPELHLSASAEELQELQDDASMVTARAHDGGHMVGQPARLASIFTKDFYKKRLLVIVRHGQSTYNAHSHDKGEPDVWDARLTQTGEAQARNLRADMRALIQKHRGVFGDPLFVTSPLSRAIQTMMLMIPFQEQLQAGELNLAVCDLHTEQLKTTGDVGRMREDLVADFPQLEPALMASLPEGRWWYQEGSRTNCAERKLLGSCESQKDLDTRVQRFRGWLRNRSERFIIVVGHSIFWNKFDRQGDDHMKNCEWRVSKNL